jgi:membrane protease YdiL (CAAX protease family)
MRPIRALVIYFILVFLGGALLAPWLWHLAQVFSSVFPGSTFAQKLANAPFHRFLDRAFLLLALLGIWPLMRSLGATSWREIGLPPPYGQAKRLFGGFFGGLLSSSFILGVEVAAGSRSFNHNITIRGIIGAIFSALAAAIAVGVLEEILFRGAIFGGLRRVLYWPFALGISSVIFAFVHFLNRANISGPVGWDSGLVSLPRLFDFHALIPGFLGLLLVAILLGLAYQRTGTLYFSIGLHIGWVFILKIFVSLTIQSPTASIAFWGSDKMIDGWLAFLVLILTMVVFIFLPLEKRPPYTILN